jgi:bifunctional DNA-binding transcriptional regulator/antitoxin component of YhaV-PrlF toxin-antitoxin module
MEGSMAKQTLRFRAKIEGREVGAVAAIAAPVDVREFFGTRARVPIRGTINGYPFRSSLSPYGGRHLMPVNKELRAGAGVDAGDIVEVVMERDEEERTVEAPAILKKELARNKTAQANWEKLSFTHKKEMALAISGAKQEETRTRRLAKIMQILKTGARWTG